MYSKIETTSRSFTRHAVKIAFIYLMIRSLPILLMYVMAALPDDMLAELTQNQRWLFFFHPPIPIQLPDVPALFQDNLFALPSLVMETLLVFLFSNELLSRKPWLVDAVNGLRQWLPLLLLILLWSWLARAELFKQVYGVYIADLVKLQNAPSYFDQFPKIIKAAHGTLVLVSYLSMPLWALLPPCLHFWLAARRSTTEKSTQPASDNRSSVFAAFLFGFVLLHTVFALSIYTQFWPWAVEATNTHIPEEMLHSIDWSLIFSQLMLVLMAGLMAAWMYTRRQQPALHSGLQTIVGPILTGMAAYLLTSLILITLFWLAAYISPDLIQNMERGQHISLVVVAGFNIAAVVVLCLVSIGMRRHPRYILGLGGILLAMLAIPVWINGVIFAADKGITGSRPGMAVTGTLGDAKWRSMDQWCTGVTQTPENTWLTGRQEERNTSDYVPEGTPDLRQMIDPAATAESDSFFSRPVVSMISRLQQDGSFKLVATVPEITCLVTPPDSETVFLFTGLKRPEEYQDAATAAAALAPEAVTTRQIHKNIDQDVIFRSTDQGESWEILKGGFMAEVNSNGWDVKPVFVNEQEVWAWGDTPNSDTDILDMWEDAETPTKQASDGAQLTQTGLFYSPDQGKTAIPIYSSEPLFAPESWLHAHLKPQHAQAEFANQSDNDANRFIVQVDNQRAYAWLSESRSYEVGEEYHRLQVTTRATLTRDNRHSEWQVTQITRQSGEYLAHVITSADGRSDAILQTDDGEWLVRLNKENGQWIERHKIPTLLPDWLVENNMNTRYFQSNGDYQVVSLWGDITVPRILMPFSKDAAALSVSPHFYTHDGGKSWHQLAIPGYLGVMGLSPHGGKLYWSKGNWYNNQEKSLWEYDLAK